MTTKELIYIVKRSIKSEPSLQTSDIGERDVLTRINTYRMMFMQDLIRKEGLSALPLEYVQHFYNKPTVKDRLMNLTVAKVTFGVGTRLSSYNSRPMISLSSPDYLANMDMVTAGQFHANARHYDTIGGYIATSFSMEEATIYPYIESVSGWVALSNPTLMDGFNVETSEYPSTGEMTRFIVQSIMEEYGVRRQLDDDELTYQKEETNARR